MTSTMRPDLEIDSRVSQLSAPELPPLAALFVIYFDIKAGCVTWGPMGRTYTDTRTVIPSHGRRQLREVRGLLNRSGRRTWAISG